MYECCRKKDSGAEMSRKEKEVVRYREAGEAASDDREGAC
jgi:hypothetical protein